MRKKPAHHFRISFALFALIGLPAVIRLAIGALPAIEGATRQLAVVSASLMYPDGILPTIDAARKESEAAKEPEPEPEPTDDVPTVAPSDTSTAPTTPENPPEKPEDAGTIISEQFATGGTSSNYVKLKYGYIRNTTNVANSEVAEIAAAGNPIKIDGNGPQVLIMHTHATESFEKYDLGWYDRAVPTRSTDDTINTVAIGDEITKQLNAAGISTLHDNTQHDYPSYNGAYDRSAETVKKYLAEYPSIKIVLDIHRDAIERDGGIRVKPTVNINGKNAAQVMVISCCDDGKNGLAHWRENLKFAAGLQDSMEKNFPGFTRPIFLAYRFYNQNLTTGSLLIEVGAHGNTIDEVKYSGELIGKSLAALLKQGG